MARTSPGVTTGVGDRIQIRGAMTHQNRFLLNGTDIADNLTGGASGEEYYVEDNIQEIQVIQSPVNARYGNFSGGVINAVTKSGGNTFTGIVRGTFYRTSWSAQAPRGDQPNTAPANAGNLGVRGRTDPALDRHDRRPHPQGPPVVLAVHQTRRS